MEVIDVLGKVVGTLSIVLGVSWVIWYLFTKEGDKQYKAWREIYWEGKKAPHNTPLKQHISELYKDGSLFLRLLIILTGLFCVLAFMTILFQFYLEVIA
jgi:hypothetical protein